MPKYNFTGGSNMSNSNAIVKNKSFRATALILILLLLLIAAFLAGFNWYVNSCRLFPDMGGIGTDHYASEDHCGLYTYGVNEDITASERNEIDKLVLCDGKLSPHHVRVDTTSYQKYGLLPCDKPVDVSLIFDEDQQLCCTELVYHYTDDELDSFDSDMEVVTEAVDDRLRGNPLTAVYKSMAEAFGKKQYTVVSNVTTNDTQLVVREFYRSNAYDS